MPKQISEQAVLTDLLEQQSRRETIEEIHRGLAAGKKYISSRFFYDEQGSRLFETITTLPEYYPTRTEVSILEEMAPDLIGQHKKLSIVELGSGDCSKISILLDALSDDQLSLTTYYPVDISDSALLNAANCLSRKYPGLQVHGIVADFMQHLERLPGNGDRLVCFFGSTIGNLTRNQADDFLAGLAKVMHPGDELLLGLDMVKEEEILHHAYNDSRGVTEAFNRNILHVVNELAGTDFSQEDFEHLAFYNRDERRMEMHLVARKELTIQSPHFEGKIYMGKGETIHTEHSHKFEHPDIVRIGEETGLKVADIFQDSQGWFSLVRYVSV